MVIGPISNLVSEKSGLLLRESWLSRAGLASRARDIYWGFSLFGKYLGKSLALRKFNPWFSTWSTWTCWRSLKGTALKKGTCTPAKRTFDRFLWDGCIMCPASKGWILSWTCKLIHLRGGGNSNILIFAPILGEMIQFDGCIFFKWVGEPTTNQTHFRFLAGKDSGGRPMVRFEGW